MYGSVHIDVGQAYAMAIEGGDREDEDWLHEGKNQSNE